MGHLAADDDGRHDEVMAVVGDFYEDDEPIDEIIVAFNAGPKGLTGKRAGWTDYLKVPGLLGLWANVATVSTSDASTEPSTRSATVRLSHAH